MVTCLQIVMITLTKVIDTVNGNILRPARKRTPDGQRYRYGYVTGLASEEKYWPT